MVLLAIAIGLASTYLITQSQYSLLIAVVIGSIALLIAAIYKKQNNVPHGTPQPQTPPPAPTIQPQKTPTPTTQPQLTQPTTLMDEILANVTGTLRGAEVTADLTLTIPIKKEVDFRGEKVQVAGNFTVNIKNDNKTTKVTMEPETPKTQPKNEAAQPEQPRTKEVTDP